MTWLAAPTAPAFAATPYFQLPFPCGEVWGGDTRANHPSGSNTYYGLDLNRTGDDGALVVASAAGTAYAKGSASNARGYYVEIDHGGGWTTIYAHLQAGSHSALGISASGTTVALGTPIGRVGSTGSSTAPHLHYDQRLNGVPQHAVFNGDRAVYQNQRNQPQPNPPLPVGRTQFISRNCGGVPQSTAEAYVRRVYADLLNRAPDPTGLAGWTAALTSGTPYSGVANGITASDEYRLRLIDASYQELLGRAADPGGAQAWLQVMRNGARIEDVQNGLVTSQEFSALAGGTNAGWVARLYSTVLGRAAGASEVNAWVGQLNAGASRVDVARGFLLSTERLNRVVDDLYLMLLDRGVDPAGRSTWVPMIQGGTRLEEIIASLVASPEYLNRA